MNFFLIFVISKLDKAIKEHQNEALLFHYFKVFGDKHLYYSHIVSH